MSHFNGLIMLVELFGGKILTFTAFGETTEAILYLEELPYLLNC